MDGKKGKEINEKTKKKMAIIRNILLIVGIPLVIVGVIQLVNGFATFFDEPIDSMTKSIAGGLLLMFGLIMTFGAISLTTIIKRREITKYFIEEGGMALNTTDEEALDGFGRAIIKGTEAMAKGLSNAGGIKISSDNNLKEKIMVKCRDCGTLNDENAQFCDQCGKKL